MSAPGVANGNHFAGPLYGQLPSNLGFLSGSAVGSFVNNGDMKAAGVIGNWNVVNSAYRAGGIFPGAGSPIAGAARELGFAIPAPADSISSKVVADQVRAIFFETTKVLQI
jgi:hypothetical protein